MSCKRLYPLQFQNIKGRQKLFRFPRSEENIGLICAICNDILVEPQQTECGCRFCYSCVNAYVQNCQRLCPGCHSVIESIKENIIYDKAVEKTIFELEIICINLGCQYVCKMRHLVDHLKECEHRKTQCNLCGELDYFNKEDVHKTEYCKMIIMVCKDCGTEMTIKEYEETHKNIKTVNLLCNKWSGVCPNDCSDEIQLSIKTHLLDCPHTLVECALSQAGCTTIMRKVDMPEHMRTDAVKHTSLMAQEIMKLKLQNAEIKLKCSQSTNKLDLECDKLKQTIESSSSLVNNLRKKLELCDNRHSMLQNEAKILKNSINNSKINSKLSHPSARSFFVPFQWEIDKILDKINDAKRGTNVYILSDSFYTGSPGYKMSLKMYPNGDGDGSGEYISMYFVLMNGDFDDIISWPFTDKVSISLLNNSVTNGCTVNLKPDTNEKCYGRPSKLYNLAAGQPKFISHKTLLETRGLTNEDSFVVRVIVQ